MKRVAADRYLVTRPDRNSGLGANLLSMAAALYVCERTGRTLVVDWTGMVHLRDTAANFFTAFFEPLRSWRTIDIRYVNDPDEPARSMTYDSAQARRPGLKEHRDLIDGKIDDPVIMLEAFHYRIFDSSPLSRAAVAQYTRQFFNRLTPRAPLAARLAALSARFEPQIVIGLHVRSGNGEFAAGGPYWNRVNTAIFDRDSFVDRMHAACRDCASRLPEAVRDHWSVFVSTDSLAMQQRLLMMPRAFALRQQFPPEGAGHQFAAFDDERYRGYTDVESMNETIIDMFMLAECQGLVCNESAFNLFAQHKTMFFCGNVRPLERYFEHPIKRLARRALRVARRT